ncbi:MAG TPA: acyl carrier protein [Frankiaceae bacterium]|nr:acyl carrier protein [Frankiaceae bacterium]
MTPEQVFAAVREAIVTVMEVEPGTVTRDTRLVEDLGCDSLALVEIADVVEELLPVTIDDPDLDDIRTVGEAVDYAYARLANVSPLHARGR